MLRLLLPLLFFIFSVSTVLAQGEAAPTASPVPQAVTPLNANEFRQLLAEQRGKVVLVNLWATWCAPCLKELPELVKLQAQFQAEGLQVITISMDEPELLEGRVTKLWRERAPTLPTYLQTEASQDKFVSVIDPAWAEIMPTNFVIDRTGKLKTTLTGGKTLAEFTAAIKPLL